MCPEGAVLKALLQHLLLRIPDDVILDMEAGLEHMGRASARGVDAMISLVEPGMRSVQTAARIRTLAAEIGIQRTFIVANKIREPSQQAVLERALGEQTIIGVIPYCENLIRADLHGGPVLMEDEAFGKAVDRIGDILETNLGSKGDGHG
jgi:CO dehydrogenase maturation factor